MNIMLICGSISQNSHTEVLMEVIGKKLSSLGINPTIWNLRKNPLPIALPEFHHKVDEYPDASVKSFIRQVRLSDAFVLGSPLYHGSFSGVLKNSLDHLWYDAFRDKPVALVSHGGSDRRCAQPCLHLQAVVKTMYGYSIQTEVATTNSDFSINLEDIYMIKNQEIISRLNKQVNELIDLAGIFLNRRK